MGNLVSVDEASSACTYYIRQENGMIVKTEFGRTYDSAQLRCMTPSGLIPFSNLSPVDGGIYENVVRINPANIKQLGFRLTQPAPRDHEKSVVIHGITIPFVP